MKRASILIVSRFNSGKFRPNSPLVQLNRISDATSASSPLLLSPTREITASYKTSSLIVDKVGFHRNPCQNMNTLIEQRTREKSDLEDAFESAETTDEMLELFKEMESSFDDKELGLASLKLGLQLDREGEDPEKVITYAGKALKAFSEDDKPSLLLAMTLQLMGSANYGLNRFNDSLGYLNKANRILIRLEADDDSVENIKPVMHAVQLELANVKNAMGRREEALENLKKCLEIKEMTLEEDSRELGVANRSLAEAYVAVLNFKEALPYGLSALSIHKKALGNNSPEVAHDRRLLGVIYTGLEQHEDALKQNELSQRVFKNWGMNTELIRAEIEAANMQIALGKYEEAIVTLKETVHKTDKDSETRAMVFIAMAKALGSQEKHADSKRCLEFACKILEKKENASSVEVAEAYSEIAMQYESMNEFETAISLLQKTLNMLENLPQEQHSEGSVSARIGWLLLFTGKVSEAIPYLESAAERLKESFGSKHFGVGYVYNNLGAAYLELGRPQSAAQMFAVAKDIMDSSLGPNHADSIDACQNLSKAYSAMGNYSLAKGFQEQVIDAWDNHGDSAKDELKEAKRLMEELKVKACGDFTDNLRSKALPLPKTRLSS